jgi:hypothetical protein
MALPTASDNPFPSVLVTETAAASISSPASGKQRLFVDTDHVLKYKNSSGTVTSVSASSGISAIPNSFWSRATGVAGSITLNNTAAFAEVAAASGGPGTGGLDLTIAAASGDVIQVSGVWEMSGATVGVAFDVASIVTGSAVNWIGQSSGSNANNGLMVYPSAFTGVLGFSVLYTVQSGDISGGNIKLRLYYLSFAATNRLLVRTSTGPAFLAVANFKQ